jgi:histidinol-phosphate aminotransferase
VRALPAQFEAYGWAPSTAEIARLACIEPQEVLRFDGNTPPAPLPSSRPDALADELARIHTYPHGGYPRIHEAIAEYAGVGPENVVLGAGGDDLILLCARAFAGPGDTVAIADEPTYPLFRVAAWLAGAEVGGGEPVLTFCCRPHNPTGALVELPAARPLVVDEAYFEYAGGETAVGLLDDDDVVVIRTFSKAFGLAGARIGYALASADTAAELSERQAPAPVSTLSVALALTALAHPPDVRPLLEERERLADELRGLGLEPLPSYANFVYVPVPGAPEVFEALLRQGIAVRPSPDAIRITVRDRRDDDVLLQALADELR